MREIVIIRVYFFTPPRCFYRAAYMQGGLSYGKGVRPSVRPSVSPSVRHTREL